MAEKKRTRPLSTEIRHQLVQTYLIFTLCVVIAVVFGSLHLFLDDPYRLYFILMIVFLAVSFVIELFVLFRLPYRISRLVNTSLVSDITMVANNYRVSKEPLKMSVSGIEEFDGIKKNVTDILNSFRDVEVIDRNLDESYLTFTYESGYDHLIERESFMYNLPFLLKLNTFARSAIVLFQISGENGEKPDKKAKEELLSMVRSVFKTRTYVGNYSDNTLIALVLDVEEIYGLDYLLKKIYAGYIYEENSVTRVLYRVKIGAAVYPYSLRDSLVSDALQALIRAKDVLVYIPSSVGYGLSSTSSLDDVHRKEILIVDRLLSFLYRIRSGEARQNIKDLTDEFLSVTGYDGAGLLTRSVYTSVDDDFVCLNEEGRDGHVLFKTGSVVPFGELKPLFDAKDQANCFYSTRREELPPGLAEFYDKHHLSSVYITFFGENGKITGASYIYKSAPAPSLALINAEVLKLAMMVMNYVGMNIVVSTGNQIDRYNLEMVLRLDGRLGYTIDPVSFNVLDVSLGLKDLLGEGEYRNVKCYKKFFNRESPCEDCPFLHAVEASKPVDFASGRYTRRKLTIEPASKVAVSILLDPYVEKGESQRLRRFDPDTFLSSRSAFEEEVRQIYAEKSRGSMLFIEIEGVNQIVSVYNETTLVNLVIAVSARLRENGIGEKIYRYDDGVLAIYFHDETRIRMYDRIESIHQALSKIYTLGEDQFKLHFKYGEYNTGREYTNVDDLFSVFSKGMIELRKLNDDYMKIFGEDISRVAAKEQYVINLMESNYSNKAVDFRLQPIVDLKDDSIFSSEILLRLYDVLREQMLSPREVVQIATAAKEMGKFDSLNFRTANSLYMRYRSSQFRLYNYRGFSINLSSDSLESNEWLSRMKRFLENNRVPDNYLGMEIPESYFPEYEGKIRVWIHELAMFHLAWSVDNYRSVKISPRDLHDLGFTFVKFSRSFLLDAMSDQVSRGLYESMVRDCHYNGIKVVAEGVETEEQMVYVRSIGCDFVQGYYFYQPLNETEFISAIEENHRHIADNAGKKGTVLEKPEENEKKPAPEPSEEKTLSKREMRKKEKEQKKLEKEQEKLKKQQNRK